MQCDSVLSAHPIWWREGGLGSDSPSSTPWLFVEGGDYDFGHFPKFFLHFIGREEQSLWLPLFECIKFRTDQRKVLGMFHVR